MEIKESSSELAGFRLVSAHKQKLLKIEKSKPMKFKLWRRAEKRAYTVALALCQSGSLRARGAVLRKCAGISKCAED
jgi:hypothetical protein